MRYYVLDTMNQLEVVGVCSDEFLMKLLKVSKRQLHIIVEYQKEIKNRYVLVEVMFSDYSKAESFKDKLIDENEKFLWYIQDDGQIFRINKKNKEKDFIVPRVDGRGDLKTTINKKTYSVKNIVAKAFLKEWYENCMVVIKNGDKTNVRADNLEICSRTEWFARLQNKKENKRVGQFKGNKLVKEWNSITECANELFFDKSTLARILRNNEGEQYGLRYL